MSKVDHVTYQVPVEAMKSLYDFMNVWLRLEAIEVEEEVPDGWKVQWWQDHDGFQIHIVGVPGSAHADVGYGHFCLTVCEPLYKNLQDKGLQFIERDSGSGRLWLSVSGVRIELRSRERAVQPSGGVEGSLGAPAEPPEITSEETAIALGERFLGEARGRVVTPDPIRHGDTVVVKFEGLEHDPQMEVFIRAFAIYKEREKKYKEHWKRYGWRGALSELRKAAERAWHLLWNQEPISADIHVHEKDIDDLLDVINYAAFVVRAVEEGNRDGEGGWW